MSLERFRARHAIVDAVRYDGTEESIRKILAMLGPAVEIKGPIGVGDTLKIDGEDTRPGQWVARGKNGKWRLFEDEEFAEMYEREREPVGPIGLQPITN